MHNDEFGRLLNEGLSSVARKQNKTMGGLEAEIHLLVDQLGFSLKYHTVSGWRRGYVPKEPELVALLTRYCINKGSMQRDWVKNLLGEARYPDREACLAELFPNRDDRSAPLLTSGEQYDTASRLTTRGNGRVALPTPVSHNLPCPDYSSFVGRQNEVDWLRQKLAPRDRAWQLVLTGIGGVGKSALALFTAYYYFENYHELPPEERFEAIIWVSAKEELLTAQGRINSAPTGLVFRTLQDIYTAIAHTLNREDITRTVPEEQDRLVQKVLSLQRTLLVIDNLESTADKGVQSFLYYLPPPTKCLITSRGWVDVAAVLQLQGLSVEEAESMITEEAANRQVKLSLDQRRQLVERTSGLPLPIKLSVARLAGRETFEQVRRWLGDSTGDLPDYCIKEQIDIACRQHLGSQPLLLTCSLFDRDAGGSREALGSIADLSILDRDEALTLLQRLSLLNCTDDDRFWLLPLVQRYVTSQLMDVDLNKALAERWLRWLLTFLQQYGVDLIEHGIDLEGRFDRVQLISCEYANVLRAIRWCYEHEHWKTLISLVEGIWCYPDLVGLFSDLREMLETAIQAAQAVQDERHEGRLRRRLGKLFWLQGLYEKALEEGVGRAEEIALRYGDEVELGRVSDVRIATWTSQGHLREAERLAKTLLEAGERLNHVELKHLAAFRLSRIQFEQQRFGEALASLEQSERWCKELGWSQRLAWILHGRAEILAQQGKTDAAESLLIESLKMATAWNEGGLIAYNKLVLARLFQNTDRLPLALQLAEAARDLSERLGWTKEYEQAEELLQTVHGEGTHKEEHERQ